VVSSTPRPHFNPGKDTVPIVQEAGWAPGPVRMGGKSRPHRDSIPDRSARSQSLYRLSYPVHSWESSNKINHTEIKLEVVKQLKKNRNKDDRQPVENSVMNIRVKHNLQNRSMFTG